MLQVNSRLPIVALASALLIVGCGGNSGSSIKPPDTPRAGFYRGILTIAPGGAVFGEGTQEFFADVSENGDFTGTSPGLGLSSAATGADLTLVSNGVVLTGKVKTTKTADGFSFAFLNGDTLIATGSLAPSTLPTVGNQTLTPPAGTYDGEIFVVANGRFSAYGKVNQLTIDAEGTLSGLTSLDSGYANSPIIQAHVQPGGELSDGILVSQGSIISQFTPPKYSFDGRTLIIRFSNLLLEPGEAYLVVKQTT